MKILVIDVGGTHIKVLVTGESQPRKFASGPSLTACQMVAGVKKITADWKYDAVSIGFPGPVLRNRPVAEPRNVGKGWFGFNFRSAFDCPVKLVNDAAMQGLGSYTHGKMLFLGLGTGLGSTLIVDGVVEPMELGHLPHKKGCYESYVGNHALLKKGEEEVAPPCRGRRRSLSRRAGTRRSRARRRQREGPEEPAAQMPCGQQPQCFSRRISIVGGKRTTFFAPPRIQSK